MQHRLAQFLLFLSVLALTLLLIAVAPVFSQTGTPLQITSSAPQPLPGVTSGGNTGSRH